MERIEFISSVTLFQGLSDSEISLLNASAREKVFSQGESLTRETEDSGVLFLLKKGRVKLTKTAWNGREQTIQFYKPGEMIGLFTLFSGIPFPASAVAMEESVVIVFSRKALENAAMHEPSLMVNLFFALAMRMNECIRTVEFLSLKEIPQRLASFFLASHERAGGGSSFTLPFSQRELAKVLGTTPETLCRLIARMERENIISQEGREIRILDIELLEDKAVE